MNKLIVVLVTCAALNASVACQTFAQKDIDAKSLTNDDLVRGVIATPRVVRAAVASIERSLVTIESFAGVSTKQGRIGGIRRQGEGNTTGVVISSDGYVVTSLFNFIQQPKKITVKTHDGVRRVAEVIGRDVTRNICVLKIDGVNDLVVPQFVPASEIQVGQWAISVGVGFGDENTAISTGIVSAKNRIGGRAIQTDANISPANYGGPLLDIAGRVIGICVPLSPGNNSAGAGVEWYDSGIGFAIPIGGNEALLERLKKGEEIVPGFIGIRPTFIAGVSGASVMEVIKDSPAEKAKVNKGDLIVKIDEHDVADQTSMRQILNRYAAGDTVTLTIMRVVEEYGKPDTGNTSDEADGEDEDVADGEDEDVADDEDEDESEGEDKSEGKGEDESDAESESAGEQPSQPEFDADAKREEITIKIELGKRPIDNPETGSKPKRPERPEKK